MHHNRNVENADASKGAGSGRSERIPFPIRDFVTERRTCIGWSFAEL
jgi:hypothetical protein